MQQYPYSHQWPMPGYHQEAQGFNGRQAPEAGLQSVDKVQDGKTKKENPYDSDDLGLLPKSGLSPKLASTDKSSAEVAITLDSLPMLG